MSLVALENLEEGMILSKNLCGKNGELLLSKGTELKSFYIKKIASIGLTAVFIADGKPDIDEEEPKSNLQAKIKDVLFEAFKNIFARSYFSTEKIKQSSEVVRLIINNVLKNEDLMNLLTRIYNFDIYGFYHSVNVAVLASVMGFVLSLNQDSISDLIIGGLLHDVGKSAIEKELWDKKDVLSAEEFNRLKLHSIWGYKLIYDFKSISDKAKLIVIQHHEKFDGTGYPLSISGEKIDLLSRLVALAEVYDALTSKASFRDALSPIEAMEYIMGSAGTHFDERLVKLFIYKIIAFPEGSYIELSDNSRGVVLKNYEGICYRPRVRIEKQGNIPVRPYIIDLAKDEGLKNLTVVKFADN